MVGEGNDDPLEEAAVVRVRGWTYSHVFGGGSCKDRGRWERPFSRLRTYPCFLKFQATQCHRQRIHTKTSQHQQSNHLNYRHLHQTGPVLLVTHPELSLTKNIIIY